MLEVVALGGLGEFGMNMLALTWGETTIVVDAGVMFPDPELLGVDRIIPDLAYLQQKGRVAALVLTHGHEDHIGGVPHVLPLVDGPIYGTPLTLAMVEPKLEEHGIDGRELIAVRPHDRVTVGPFEIEFIRVTHSMPDCVALAIHTPAGIIVHTGDFKIDQTPIDGEHFDVHRFAQLGSEGVLALFADSTNIDRRGFTGSELEVVEAFEEIFTSATGKLIVAAFASSIYRMQILVDLAAQFDRKVAFVGRGMMRNSEIAQRLGYLRIPAGVQIRDSEIGNYPAQDVLCLATRSPRLDRRHAYRGSRRRGPSRSAAPRRGRTRRTRRGHQQAAGRPRGRTRDHHARLRDGGRSGAARRRGALSQRRRGAGEPRRAHRSGTDQGEAARRAAPFFPQTLGAATLGAARLHGDLTRRPIDRFTAR